jgi:amidase
VVFRQDQHARMGQTTVRPSPLFGPTVNPWSPSITPGGSSGGSARGGGGSSGARGLGRRRHRFDPGARLRVVASSVSSRAAATSFAPGAGHGLEGLVNEHPTARSATAPPTRRRRRIGSRRPVHRPASHRMYLLASDYAAAGMRGS